MTKLSDVVVTQILDAPLPNNIFYDNVFLSLLTNGTRGGLRNSKKILSDFIHDALVFAITLHTDKLSCTKLLFFLVIRWLFQKCDIFRHFTTLIKFENGI